MPRRRNGKLSKAFHAAIHRMRRLEGANREQQQRRVDLREEAIHEPHQRRVDRREEAIREEQHMEIREEAIRQEQRVNRREEAILEEQAALDGQVQRAKRHQICYMVVEGHQKLAALITLLNTKDPRKKFVVLMSSVEAVEYFSLILKHFLPSFTVVSVHEETEEYHKQVGDQFRDLATTGLLVCTDIIARGIINCGDIDWMIQFDPPWRSLDFIHRWGKLLVFLQPTEVPYVSFIHERYLVKMIQLKLPHDLPDNLAEIRQMQLNDRRLMTKANEAYDNYVLSYMKHECPDLVRGVVVLDYGRLAVGFGILKLPDFFRRIDSKHLKIDFFKPMSIP